MQHLPGVAIFISIIERSDLSIPVVYQMVMNAILPRGERVWARENAGGKGVPKMRRYAHAVHGRLPKVASTGNGR
ncbi:hypothetical protein PBR20603_03339 [Pandoraea bronchicola]|uniref:Uncharacterized protein n=1 Tax=Pandoraea bronchicola TaxID=2508287 RepID=A0A5E5BYG2_9BURK|nr:hypothetical protein PBR20603_03339 [Pandoraea bronchicola]